MSVDLAEAAVLSPTLNAAFTGTPTRTTSPVRPAPALTPSPVHIDPMLRLGNAFYLAIHGVAHAAGSAALLGSADLYSSWTTPTGTAAVVVATAWAAIGTCFVLAAVLLAIGRGWRRLLTVTTVASVAACLFFLPGAWLGLVANSLVILGLAASRPRH